MCAITDLLERLATAKKEYQTKKSAYETELKVAESSLENFANELLKLMGSQAFLYKGMAVWFDHCPGSSFTKTSDRLIMSPLLPLPSDKLMADCISIVVQTPADR